MAKSVKIESKFVRVYGQPWGDKEADVVAHLKTLIDGYKDRPLYAMSLAKLGQAVVAEVKGLPNSVLNWSPASLKHQLLILMNEHKINWRPWIKNYKFKYTRAKLKVIAKDYRPGAKKAGPARKAEPVAAA